MNRRRRRGLDDFLGCLLRWSNLTEYKAILDASFTWLFQRADAARFNSTTEYLINESASARSTRFVRALITAPMKMADWFGDKVLTI